MFLQERPAYGGPFPERLAEAEALLLKAEVLLEKEVEIQTIQQLAGQALNIFVEIGDNFRVGDALRILLHILRYEDKRKEAATLARTWLDIFKEDGDRHGEAKMSLSLAEINYDKRGSKNRELALEQAQQAKDIFVELRDRRMEAYALLAYALASHKKIEKNSTGTASQQMWKEFEHVQETASMAVQIFKQVDDRKGQGAALHVLTVSKMQANEPASAEQSLEETVKIYHDLGIKKIEAFEKNLGARWKLSQGKQDEALKLSEEATVLFKESGVEHQWEAGAIYNTAQALVAQKETGRAIKVAREARTRFREAGDRKAEVHMAMALVSAQRSNGEQEEALGTAQEALHVVRQLGFKRLEGRMQLDVASLQLGEKRLFRAKQAAERALLIFQVMKDTHEQAYALHLLSQIHLERHHNEQALSTLRQEAKMYSDSGNAKGEVRAWLDSCNACVRSQQLDDALAMAIKARELARQHGETMEEVVVLRVETELQMCLAQFEKALQAAREGKTLMRELGDEGGEAFMSLLMGQAYVHLLMEFRPKNEEGKMPQKKHYKDAVETSHTEAAVRVLRYASALAKRHGRKDLVVAVLTVLAQIYILADEAEGCLQAALEAAAVAHQLQDLSSEAYALLIASSAHVLAGNEKGAKETAEKSFVLFAQGGDHDGKATAETMLDRPMDMEFAPAEVVSAASSSAQRNVNFMLDREMVKSRVAAVTKQIVGGSGGDEIEGDSPLLQNGLTSMSSAMLWESLMREFPESNLPFVLAFDFPTINSVADFLVHRIGM